MNNFSIVHWFFLFVAIAVVIGVLKNLSGGAVMFCTSCGQEGPTKTRTKGNLALEIVLYLLLVVPGLIYSIWRLSTRSQVCKSCGAETLVPVDSPVALKMRKDLA